MSSIEGAKDKIERVAGAGRAQMGDMTRDERSQAERVMRRDEAQGRQPGERVQEDARNTKDTFTT